MRFKSIGIAIAMIFSLCLAGIVNQSDAASASLSVYASDDWGDGGYAYAYVTADENIDFIDWYINDDPNDPNSDYEYSFSTMHGNMKSVYEYLGSFTGHSKGSKYGVKAVVSFEESSDEDATGTFRVFRPTPAWNNGTGGNTGASGYATIWGHYCDGSAIVMSASASAYNPFNNPEAKDPDDNPLKVEVWFRVIEYESLDGNAKHPEHGRDIKPVETIQVGESSEYYSPDSFIVDVQLGGPIGRNQKLYYDSHTHLMVYTTKGNHKEDHWEADTGVQEFTYKDNP